MLFPYIITFFFFDENLYLQDYKICEKITKVQSKVLRCIYMSNYSHWPSLSQKLNEHSAIPLLFHKWRTFPRSQVRNNLALKKILTQLPQERERKSGKIIIRIKYDYTAR